MFNGSSDLGRSIGEFRCCPHSGMGLIIAGAGSSTLAYGVFELVDAGLMRRPLLPFFDGERFGGPL